MERPAFWKVPRDLQDHQLTEGLSAAQSPGHGQDKHTPTTDQDKPALSTLASYSVGFANLGLKGAHLATRVPIQEPAPPSTPLIGEVEKPALSALACHAIGFADLGLKEWTMGEFHLRTFTVTINRRNTHTAWGISIAGGCDQGSPLVITKVQSGSPAEGVVQRGDLVRKVTDYDSRDVRHQDVQTLFKNSGNSIKLVVSRETRGSAPHSAPGSRAGSVPPLPTAMGSAKGTDSPYIMASLNPALIDHPRQRTASPHRAELEEEIQMVTEQPYRTTPLVLPGAKIKKDALPTESYLRHHPNPLMRAPPPLHGLPHEVLMKQKVADTILQRVVADDPNKKVMPQFNSPIGLYSEDNIVNTIQQQTGATPYKKTVVYDPAKSETYKALKESEFGDTLQEIPTPVEPKVFSPAKVNTKTTPHRSVAAHSVPGPMHNINSVGASAENIQQSNTFKRLMHMVLEEENY